VRESAASDHDAERAPARATAAPDDVPADDILRFPRGVDAGDCLHAVFERADFADPSTWDAAIARALRDHPVALRGVAERLQQPLLHAMIARMLGDVLRTELPDGIRLDAVSRQHRLTELEFNLPAANLTASSLNAVLHALDYRVDRLTFARLDGYLKGFIDLVFEHRGRYYLLDWKSNHLGYTGDDYGPPSLAVAMAQHGYHLQSLLYAIALTRYLARRVPGYRHDMHFGGVLYLFVRGVRPTWRTADGAASGVQFDRPSVDALARFDAWFPAR
jgi:exodeoxyribonuclease V beta subunit